MDTFTVQDNQPLEIACTPPLSDMYQLSPWVWQDDAGYGLLLRAVPRLDDTPAEKIARIYYGRSEDGLRFVMGKQAVITPGPGYEDQDGCEDPTLAVVDGKCYVYYSGWNEARHAGQLLLATGPDCSHLQKRGGALASSPGLGNPKEATIIPVADGTWRLFFEYAEGDASRIGLAASPAVDGPWTVLPSLFAARPGGWDGWHLSTGPLLSADPQRPVMFYNGATQDAHWRIGWIAFDAEFARVVARSDDPLITPPCPEGDATDIAFASSVVACGDEVWLYYSVADKDMFRATIQIMPV